MKKGFTLIELLVVIAIISLLASVVMASLSDSREKAAIAAFKEEASQIRTAMELYRSNNNSYPGSNDIPADTDPNSVVALSLMINHTWLVL